MKKAETNQKLGNNILPNYTKPYIPKGCHPVETGRYRIPTIEIARLYETIIRWVENRSPGGIVHGRPRIGKTEAIRYMMKNLKNNISSNLPVYHILCDQHNKPNENAFFDNLLRDIGNGLSLSGNSNVKRERLMKFFIVQGETSALNHIILFIDDAQRLFEIQYGWLMDIHNLLNNNNICLTVILVGQDELIHQKNAFIQAKKAQIIGRFMVHEYKFTGIKSIQEMNACLKGYDTDSEYPLDSGWTFTRYFFPESFSQGNRLENSAEDLFTSFLNLRLESGLKKPFEIPMQYLTLTIEYVLRKFGAYGANANWPTCNHWIEAIKNSGYIEAEMYQEVI